MSKRWNEFNAVLLGDIDDSHLLPYSAEDEAVNERTRTLPLGTMYQFARLVRVEIVDANYTVKLIDFGRVLLVTGERTITLPQPSLANIPTGFPLTVVNYDTDPVTLAADSTLNAAGDTLAEQYDHARVIHVGGDVWLAMGDLSEAS